jgi:hypothetical protein
VRAALLMLSGALGRVAAYVPETCRVPGRALATMPAPGHRADQGRGTIPYPGNQAESVGQDEARG